MTCSLCESGSPLYGGVLNPPFHVNSKDEDEDNFTECPDGREAWVKSERVKAAAAELLTALKKAERLMDEADFEEEGVHDEGRVALMEARAAIKLAEEGE